MKSNPTKIRNAIDAGLFKAFGHEITPKKEDGQIVFFINGDIEKTLSKIAANAPVGSRDVVEAIKSTRSMIFMLKDGR